MSVSSTTSLTALPTELLSLIVSKIASKSILCRLARCSRQLHLCTIPHLYGRIKIQEDEEQRDKRLIMLTASLLRRPDLAKLVRQFSSHVVDSYKVHRPFKPSGAFATAFDPSRLSQEEVINFLGQYDRTHAFRHESILSFLLPSLLKVEKLVLDVLVNIDRYFLEEALRKPFVRERVLDTQSPFEVLRVFAQSTDYYSHERKLDFLALLLKLPAIQEITGHFVKTENVPEDYYDDFDEEKLANSHLKELDSSSSPLTSLELALSVLPSVDMCHILRVPIALKRFSVLVFSCHDIDCKNLPRALEPQKDYLETITIWCSPFIQSARQPGHNCAPMASFTHFSALKVFKTEALFLTATVHGNERHSLLDMFPPSLETLHLISFQSNFSKLLEALERLLAYKSSRQIPSLKTLILEETVSYPAPPTRLTDVLWGDTQETAIEKLSGVAESQNVTFEVIEESTFKWSLEGVWK